MQWKVAMKIVHQQANGRFPCLTSGHQSIDHLKQAISIQYEKYNRFIFVHS